MLLRVAIWLTGFAAIALASERSLLHEAPPARTVTELSVSVVTDAAIAVVDEKYLSVAIDMANVVGGAFWDPSTNTGPMGTARVQPYDFSRPRLRKLAAALAPAFLRVGGTDADRTSYELATDVRQGSKATWNLSTKQWRSLNTFAQDVGFRVIFTLNAGHSARNEQGEWDPRTARALIEDATSHKYPVDVWEFGNELNVYPVLHQQWLPPQSYSDDLQKVRWLLGEVSPKTRLAGPAVAFWPHIGEGLPFLNSFMQVGGDLVDVVTWHYYPQQSFRCPVATNRAKSGRVLRPQELAEVDRWAKYVEQTKLKHNSHAELWLGETGGAQCGGEPELSDRFASSLWWVDQLGRIARRGQKVVVRQTLSGGDYGLVDETTLSPNPDYWASLLWRRTMGTHVLNTSVNVSDAPVQAYAHCLQGSTSNGIAIALVNEHPSQTTTVSLPHFSGTAQLYLVKAANPKSRTITINDVEPRLSTEGDVPQFLPKDLNLSPDVPLRLPLPPLSYAFVVFPQATVPACVSTLN